MSFSVASKPAASLFSRLLVVVQFACAGWITVVGALPLSGFALMVFIAGVVVGGWAIMVMRRTRFRIVPEVHTDAYLMQDGPYRYLRHPMYAALLLVMASFVMAEFTGLRAILWGLLVVDLLVKLLYEESLLRCSFPGYDEYCRKTWRLLPFIF